MSLAAALVLALLAQSEPVVLKGGRIVSMSGPEIENGSVAIVDGKIKAFGVDVEVPVGAKVLELPKGAWILPGFIDAHSHLGSAFEVEESTEPLTPEAKAVEAFTSRHPEVRAAMASGVTLVALSPGNGNVIGGRIGLVRLNGERYDQAVLKDAVAIKASIGKEALRPDREPTSRTGAVSLLRARLSDPEGLPLLPIFLHGTTPGDVDTALSLQLESRRKFVLVHARPSEDQLKSLASTGTPVAVEPLTVSDLKETLTLPSRLAKAGVRFAFVSDAPSTTEEMLRVSAAFAMKYGLDRKSALEALTTVPADLLGVSKERGSLAAGKSADVVVWSGDPLSLASETELVLIDGKVVWRKGSKP